MRSLVPKLLPPWSVTSYKEALEVTLLPNVPPAGVTESAVLWLHSGTSQSRARTQRYRC